MTIPITSSPSAPPGSVSSLSHYSARDFSYHSAVLCRNTAPLVTLAYGLIQHEVQCKILGRDIGAGLCAIVRKQAATNIPDLCLRLRTWQQREIARIIADNGNPDRIYDQYQCLQVFIEALPSNEQSIGHLLTRIEVLFSDQGSSNVTLCTVHKAKGLEWEKVFILDFHLMPSKYAVQPWQYQQELNLVYVALTRAKLDLVYIQSDRWKEAEYKEQEEPQEEAPHIS